MINEIKKIIEHACQESFDSFSAVCKIRDKLEEKEEYLYKTTEYKDERLIYNIVRMVLYAIIVDPTFFNKFYEEVRLNGEPGINAYGGIRAKF